MTEANQGRSLKTKVFISYSRRDMAAADALVAALEARGIEVKIDRRDLPLLEEWQRELIGFIRQCDAAILLISPNWLASPWCEWEIQRIQELSKRLAPVVIEPVEMDRVPEAARKINVVFVDDPARLDERMDALVAALNSDIGWVKEHTRLGELALRWDERGRASALVLRGKEIEDAERWIALRPPNAPRASALQATYIAASRRAATQRWRAFVGALGLALVVTSALGVMAYLSKLRADRERDGALISQSRFLADLSRQSAARSDYGTALSLALEGLPQDRSLGERPLVTESLTALQQATYNLLEARVVDVGRLVTGFSTFGVNPDYITSLSSGTEDHSGQTDWVFLVERSPSWPWQLLAAAGQGAGSGSGSAGSPIRLVQGSGNNHVQVVDLATRKVLIDVPGHDGWTYRARLSDDGSRLVTLGEGKTRAKLWDATTGALVADLKGFEGGVWSAEFSQAGARLITADGLNKTGRVFDARTGEAVATLGPLTGSVTLAALSADGRLALTGTREGETRLWQVDRPAESRVLDTFQGAVTGASFSADGLSVLTYAGRTARIHATQSPLRPVSVELTSRIIDAQLSPDATKVVATLEDGTAALWETLRGTTLATLTVTGEELQQACFAPDGGSIVTFSGTMAFGTGVVREWHLTPRLAPSLHGRDVAIDTAVFSPDGRLVVTGAEGGELLGWDARTGALSTQFEGHRWGPDHISFSADGALMLSGGRDGTVRLWDTTGRELRGLPTGRESSIRAAALSRDGKLAAAIPATGDPEAFIVVWNAEDGRELRRISGAGIDNFVSLLAFSDDGSTLTAGNALGSLTHWDVASGKSVAKSPALPATLEGETISSSKGLTVSIPPDRNSRLELDDGKGETKALVDGGNSLASVRLAPDGGSVAVGDVSGNVSVITIAESRSKWTHVVRGKPAEGLGTSVFVRFSPDGRKLAAASETGSTHVLDAETGALLVVLPGEAGITSVAFSPSGEALLTRDTSGRVRLWQLPASPAALIEEARRSAPRCLAPDERTRVFLERDPPAWCTESRRWPYGG